MRLTIGTWNLHQGGLPSTWDALVELGADIVLVQEARSPHPAWQPPPQLRAWPPLERPDVWASTGGRYWCAGIVQLNPSLDLRPRGDLHVRSASGPEEDGPEGIRGNLAVCDVFAAGSHVVTVASAYGMWETDETGTRVSERTMGRILDELAPTATQDAPLVVGGDFNIWIQPYQGGVWPAYAEIFERFSDLGLVDCLQERDGWGRAPLLGCSCGTEPTCRHVRTYRHRWDAASNPWQNDYIFATAELAGALTQCKPLDDERYWTLSDHCPVVASFEL